MSECLINKTFLLVKSALILCALFLSGCSEDTDGPHRFKFLITANVEVDGELKSGSSVIEVLYNKPNLGGFGANHIVGARGTMPIVDLGRGKFIVLSFRQSIWNDRNHFTIEDQKSFPFKTPSGCGVYQVKYIPTRVMLEGGQRRSSSEIAKELNSIPIGKKFKFTNQSMLMHIVDSFNSKSRHETYNFCSLNSVLGERYRSVSITIERTEKPLNFFINPAPKWLEEWRMRCRPMKDWLDGKNDTKLSELRERLKDECPFFHHIETQKYDT